MSAPRPAPADPVDDVALEWGRSDVTGPEQHVSTGATPRSETAPTPALLLRGLLDEIRDSLPRSWSSYLVEIAVAGAEHLSRSIVEVPGRGLAPLPLNAHVPELAAAHRALTAEPAPWMWLRINETRGGEPVIHTFDGFVGSPPAYLMFSADTYRTDVSTTSSAPQPLWLLAHLHNRGEQLRSATVAAATPPAQTIGASTELPPLDLLWPRFAALAAVFAGLDAPDGPRMNNAFGVFRGTDGGCSLARLPGGRAVLSGGADHSTLLTAAYLGELPWPDLYRGAPHWVTNLVLDERATVGMISFCYWWSDGHWSRAILSGTEGWSALDEITPAVPGVWTSATTVELVQSTLAQGGITVSTSECAAYVHQVCDGIMRPDLLLALDGSHFQAAEGLVTLDLAQEW